MVRNGFKHFVRSLPRKYSLLVLLISGMLVSELYFGWIEYLLGQWLLSGNAGRPELGLVWEVERKKQLASDQLAKLVNNRFPIQHVSVSFACLLASLTEGRGIVVSDAHFIDFYRQLPTSIANKIFSPYLVLKVFSERALDRVYIEKIGNKINICLLSEDNSILEQSNIVQELINANSMRRPNFNGNLDNLPSFSKRIYSADIFFSTLLLFSENIRREILSSPEKLINIDGEILRVGLSDKTRSDKVEIGAEIEDSQGYQVIFFQGQSNAVNNIMSVLEERVVCPSPPKFNSKCIIKR